jgi:HD superfamily phosphohydrolase
MEQVSQNKRKIINDPLYGFIKIPSETLFDIIEHPYFQRLRRIRQLGMTQYVYPGSNHTRFQHALGAMHLMGNAIETIRSKQHTITEEEAEAVTLAILLHDIGHGPFSHSLEMSLIRGVEHERISLMIMELLNKEFDGKLDLAIRIFCDQYEKRFLHQLVSGQLDMDRLDYLRRDSFFTGVMEGTIGSDRIIKMLEVHNDRLVVEEKGIYSIEKFLVARRLMYWQVYLHKSVLAADQLLIMMLQRAYDLAMQGIELFATPALSFFLHQPPEAFRPEMSDTFIDHFTQLDDNDIISAAKVWTAHDDPVLQFLSRGFVNRKLFAIEIANKPFPKDRIDAIKEKTGTLFGIPFELTDYLVITDSVTNRAYSGMDDNITILGKDGSVRDIAEISEILNVTVLSQKMKKFFLCYPKNLQ